MTGRHSFFFAGLMAATVALAGCGCGSEKTATKSPDAITDKKTPDKPDPPKPKTKKPARSKNAAAAVRAVLNGFHNRKPEAIWDFLPASYQKDLNGLAAKFADKMDSKLWSRFFGIVKRIIALCQSRSDEILATKAVARFGSNKDQWNNTLKLAEALVNSDLADLKRLKTIDLRAFLKATAGSFCNCWRNLPRSCPAGTSSNWRSIRSATSP